MNKFISSTNSVIKMTDIRCFSFTASKDWFYRCSFAHAGLRSVTSDLGGGTTMHCWIPKHPNQTKPNLILVHGFGANAMWQYADAVHQFTPKYNVYVPDLLFFGRSSTERQERTEGFQARCLMKLMQAHGVKKVSLVGISYGGFVGYSMAVQFPEVVQKVVLCCAGVCLEEKDMKDGLFRVRNLEEAKRILLPQTPERLRELMKFSFVKPAKVAPNWILMDFINVMNKQYVEQKKELIEQVLRDRKFSNLPKITQPTLIIWGEQDQIFPLELGYRLKRHLEKNSELVVIKNAGHAVNIEKSKEFIKHLNSFLSDSSPSTHHHAATLPLLSPSTPPGDDASNRVRR